MRNLRRAALLAASVLAPGAANAEWREYDTRNFIIYSEAPETDVTRFATRLESIDGLMRMATGVSPTADAPKLRIFQVAEQYHVQRAIGAVGSGVAGFYSNNSLGPYAVTPRKIGGDAGVHFTPDLVLFHEYAHHFMLQHSPAVYPPWYVEGFAELIGSSRFMPDGRVAYGMPAKHRGNYIAANWVPVQEMLLRPADKQHDLDLYGQGWAFTHFLTFSKTRSPQLRQYLNALSRGKNDREAASAFGDLAELNREARRYVSSGSFPYTPVNVPLSGPVIRSSTTLSAGQAALIPETMALDEGSLDAVKKPSVRARMVKQRDANLAQIRIKATRFPADPFALRLLGEAELLKGNLPEALAATDRLLALRPDDVDGLARKSIIQSTRAIAAKGTERATLAAEARKLAVRANRLDTTASMPVVAFYRSYLGAGQKAPEVALQGLGAALQERPNNDEIRLLLVNELESRGRYAEAISLIMILANSPHDSPMREAARAQLARMEAASVKTG